MSKRKVGAILFGVLTLIMIGYSLFQWINGREIGFYEVVITGKLAMIFLSAMTRGNKEEKEGVFQEEELSQKITEKSAKISYFILIVAILLAIASDQLVNGTINGFLLGVLGLAMITLPSVEFFVVQKYK